MKRFILFSFDNYSAIGGAYDIVDIFETIDEAKSYSSETTKRDNLQIFDVGVGKVVVTGITDWYEGGKLYWKDVVK